MIECSYKWSVKINESKTLRQRFALWLRYLAARIDQRVSLAIDIQTTPPLTAAEKSECLVFGIGKVKFAVEQTTRSKAEERCLDYVMKTKHAAAD